MDDRMNDWMGTMGLEELLTWPDVHFSFLLRYLFAFSIFSTFFCPFPTLAATGSICAEDGYMRLWVSREDGQ